MSNDPTTTPARAADTVPAIVGRVWHHYPTTTPIIGARVWVTIEGCCERWVSVAILYVTDEGREWRESQDGRAIANVTHWMTMDYPRPANSQAMPQEERRQ